MKIKPFRVQYSVPYISFTSNKLNMFIHMSEKQNFSKVLYFYLFLTLR